MTASMTPPPSPLASAGFGRRLLAISYELLPVLAIAFVATMAVVRFMPEDHVPANSAWFRAYLATVIGAYFVGSWTVGGQTLGMRPWKLVLVTDAGERPGWPQALMRYVVALVSWLPLGAGYWWALIDAQGRSWHDRASGTWVVARTPAAERSGATAAEIGEHGDGQH